MRKIFLYVILVASMSCKKEDPSLPVVTTNSASLITDVSAVGGGEVTDDGGLTISAKGICWSTAANPTVDDHKSDEGPGAGKFTSTIAGLDPSTNYRIRAYATNRLGTSYGEELDLRTTPRPVADLDGNLYQTVEMGNQVWMAENLKVINNSDGEAIPLVEGVSEWEGLGAADAAYCWYDNDLTNGAAYGALYTWNAAMNGEASSNSNPSGVQGVCPDGWHLPSDSEWKELEMYLGMSMADADGAGYRGTDQGARFAADQDLWAGGYLKDNPAFGSSGFLVLPGGGRRYNGSFGHLGDNANFWSATEFDTYTAWGRHIYSAYSTVHRYNDVKSDGFSVRCVRDD